MPEKLVRMYHAARLICFPKPRTWSGQQRKEKNIDPIFRTRKQQEEGRLYILKSYKAIDIWFKKYGERKCQPSDNSWSLKKKKLCTFHFSWLCWSTGPLPQGLCRVVLTPPTRQVIIARLQFFNVWTIAFTAPLLWPLKHHSEARLPRMPLLLFPKKISPIRLQSLFSFHHWTTPRKQRSCSSSHQTVAYIPLKLQLMYFSIFIELQTMKITKEAWRQWQKHCSLISWLSVEICTMWG